jgi:hypothetical protein
MTNKLFRAAMLSIALGSLSLLTGCVEPDLSGDTETDEATGQVTTRFIVFVAYFDDAAHSNLVGAATFSDCPDDPSYSWGAQASFYTIESEPCGGS